MQVIFLGTGGYHPNARRHTAGVLVPELGVLFDAGTSLFRLAEFRQARHIQLFLSHAHLDHICGLTYLLIPLILKQIDSVVVRAEPRVIKAVREHLFAEAVFPVLPPELTFEPLDAPVEQDGWRVTHFPLLRHPGGSRGFVLEHGNRRLAYVTDTTASRDYLQEIAGIELLIHECNFADEHQHLCEQTGHSHTSQVAKLAADAGVGRLVLTHIDPTYLADDPIGLETARRIFPETELASDGLVLDW